MGEAAQVGVEGGAAVRCCSGLWGVGRLRTAFTLNNLKHSSQRSCRGRANSEHDKDREEDAAAHPLAAAARAAAAKMQREEDVKKPKKPMDL